MPEFEVTGVERVLAALANLGPKGPQALAAALYQEGQGILGVSQAEYVPVDQGALRGSGFVREPVVEGPLVTVTIGYGGVAAPYALAIHENPRSGKTGGVSPAGRHYKHWATVGEWKYLETPFKAAAAGLDDRLAARLEAAGVS